MIICKSCISDAYEIMMITGKSDVPGSAASGVGSMKRCDGEMDKNAIKESFSNSNLAAEYTASS